MAAERTGRPVLPAALLAALLGALPFLGAGVGWGQEGDAAAPGETVHPGGQVLSRRIADYRIDVRLDPATRMLHGSQTLTWINLRAKPTNRLFFHLYWNAWRNRHSTWMREDRLRQRSSLEGEIAAEDWGWMEVETVGLADGGTDLTRTMYFAFPDDRNIEDRTVMVVLLPREVEPGETVRLDMTWRAKVPRTFARTGFRGDFYFIAQWFPKLGVYEAGGWNCHQFHAGTEFYADFGVYDVSMTVPEGWVLGATGVETGSRPNGDGTTTHRYLQADVHDFAWTTSPDYLVVEDRFASDALPAVDIRLLLQPEHAAQAGRHLAATKAALDRYGRWYGAYPYGHVTVVDPAYGSGAGGMEYPTLFTAGTRRFNPPGGGNPEGVTIHEAGHQFWYGMVANNEFEHAWLDEGLNTFSTARAELDAFGESLHTERFFLPPGLEGAGFFPLLLAGFDYGGKPYLDRLARYRPDATIAPQGSPSFRYHPAKGGSLSYSKTALWLRTLENRLGWERLQGILATFFERWKFRHPTARNFLDLVDAETEEDLAGFLRTVMGSADFDYAVESVATFPARNEGWVEEGSELVYVDPEPPAAAAGGAELFRSEVGVRRLGSGVFPVEVLFVFEDGHEVRRQWAGTQRWELFVEEYPARLDYAVVDPDGVLALDLWPSNNSREVEPRPDMPAWKWSARWTVWLQDFFATFGFFV